MTENIETKRGDALTGAVYFVVGRGTEGGSASYHLSVAGITSKNWGKVEKVADNSGYSIGTIQVDLGQRGRWPLGSIEERKLHQDEETYVDAIIDQASSYAKDNNLGFTDDLDQLRKDLLTHGNGLAKRTSITFIDDDTRDGINAWASSSDGKKWIHQNIDLPQARNIADAAVSILDEHGKNIAEDRRFEAVNILAKTANQMPGKLKDLEKILKDGGSYEDLLEKADAIKLKHDYFDAPKAAAIAEKYENRYADPGKKEVLDRAHAKVSSQDFDPSTEAKDEDIKAALEGIGGSVKVKVDALGDGVLKQSESGPEVKRLQEALNQHGASLPTTGYFGAQTKAAVEEFQREQGLDVDGKAGKDTRNALGIGQPEASVPLPLPGVAPAPAVSGMAIGGSLAGPGKWGAFLPDDRAPATLEHVSPRPSFDPANEHARTPDHFDVQQARQQPFFVQAMRGLDKLGAEAGGYRSQEEQERIAGALAVKASEYTPPMKEITDVVASKVNGNLFAIWVNPGNDLDVMRACVDKAQVVHQPLAGSLDQLQSMTQQQDLQRQQMPVQAMDEGARAIHAR